MFAISKGNVLNRNIQVLDTWKTYILSHGYQNAHFLCKEKIVSRFN